MTGGRRGWCKICAATHVIIVYKIISDSNLCYQTHLAKYARASACANTLPHTYTQTFVHASKHEYVVATKHGIQMQATWPKTNWSSCCVRMQMQMQMLIFVCLCVCVKMLQNFANRIYNRQPNWLVDCLAGMQANKAMKLKTGKLAVSYSARQEGESCHMLNSANAWNVFHLLFASITSRA